MESGGVDDSARQSQEVKPSLTLSRCRSKKSKLRTDKKGVKRGSGKAVSRSKSSSARQPTSSKTLPVPSFQSHDDKKLEELERSFFDDTPSPPVKKSITKPVVAFSRPPIPTFQWNDDEQQSDHEQSLEPALATKKKPTSQEKAAPTTSQAVAAATSNAVEPKPHGESSEAVTRGNGKENNNSQGKSSLLESAKPASSVSKDVSNTLTNVPQPTNAAAAAAAAATSTTTTEMAKAGNKRKAQPTHDELTRVVDQAFEKSDIHAMTVKQFILDIQELFQVTKFTVKTKAFVKKRLYYHMNERVPASESSQSPPPVKDKGKSTGPLEHKNTTSQTPTPPESSAPNEKPNGQKSLDPKPACQIRTAHDLFSVESDSDDSFQAVEINRKHPLKKVAPVLRDDAFNFIGDAKMADQPQRKMSKVAAPEQQVHPPYAAGDAPRPLHPRPSFGGYGAPPLPPPMYSPYGCYPGQAQAQPAPAPHAYYGGYGAVQQQPYGPQQIPQNVSDNTDLNTDGEPNPKMQTAASKSKAIVETRKAAANAGTQPTKATKKPPAKKPAPKRKRVQQCKLCKACPCKSKTEQQSSSSPGFDLSKLKRNERAIERKLEKRLDELQREAERYDGEADRVRRELKKRERIRLRRELAEKSAGDTAKSGNYRFLPDGSSLDNQLEHIESTIVPKEETKKAQVKLFGKEKQPVSQPTLTQLFGGESKESEEEQQEEGNDLRILDNSETGDGASVPEETNAEGQQSHSDDKSVGESIQEFSEKEDSGVAVHRVLWREGCMCNAVDNSPGAKNAAGSVWGTLVTGALQREDEVNYGCAFNRIFADESSECEDDPGIDHLLGLFENVPSAQSSPDKSGVGTGTPPPTHRASPLVGMSMLTQRGKTIAEEIQDQVMANSHTLSNLEAACPNWQENVAYALHQRDPGEIDQALDKVQKSKARLARMKESFLKALQEQETVLDVFALSLSQSRSRLDGSGLPCASSTRDSVAATLCDFS